MPLYSFRKIAGRRGAAVSTPAIPATVVRASGDALNDDLWLRIAAHLQPRDILRLEATSSDMLQLCADKPGCEPGYGTVVHGKRHLVVVTPRFHKTFHSGS